MYLIDIWSFGFGFAFDLELIVVFNLFYDLVCLVYANLLFFFRLFAYLPIGLFVICWCLLCADVVGGGLFVLFCLRFVVFGIWCLLHYFRDWLSVVSFVVVSGLFVFVFVALILTLCFCGLLLNWMCVSGLLIFALFVSPY